MNGIEKITARIESDVKAEIAAILKEGEERAAKIRADYEAKAKAETAAAQEAGRQTAARQLERLESSAKMDAKKELLAAKQACLDEAFAQAQKKLNSAHALQLSYYAHAVELLFGKKCKRVALYSTHSAKLYDLDTVPLRLSNT